MKPGDVVAYNRYGHHRAVVLAVSEDGFVIIASTSVARDEDHVAALPRSPGARSLGWSEHDTRTSYFYPSGVRAVLVAEVEAVCWPPRADGTTGPTRRCEGRLFLALRERVAQWLRTGLVTEASVLARMEPPRETE